MFKIVVEKCDFEKDEQQSPHPSVVPWKYQIVPTNKIPKEVQYMTSQSASTQSVFLDLVYLLYSTNVYVLF
jgi:hypothetical protein